MNSINFLKRTDFFHLLDTLRNLSYNIQKITCEKEAAMSQILFIEGVSGVGKSTMVKSLSERLTAGGDSVRAYVEFDYTNPIDFYCTAYVPHDTYEALCADYPLEAPALHDHAIPTTPAVLVRYFNEDTPLFSAPLLAELRKMELCYHPTRPVSLDEYTAVYRDVWERFAAKIDPAVDHYLFDGSLLHHPINDMMRNYHVSPEQALSHVQTLLSALKTTPQQVVYLYSDDLAAQLRRAHTDRNQPPPDEEYVAFWNERYEKDRYVLENALPEARIYNISENRWDVVMDDILSQL